MRPHHQRPGRLSQRLVALVAALAGLVLAYQVLGPRDEGGAELGSPVKQRGYYLVDATMTEMNTQGRPKIIVHAREAEQRVSDQGVDMTDITLDYPTEKYGNWHGTSKTGHMTPDRNTIELDGDVRMTSQQPQGPALIRTERMRYDIDHAIVQTADPVDVHFGTHVLKARGLHADLNAQTLKLESDVNGRFSP